MGTPARIKQRLYRDRQRGGRIVLRVEVSEVDLAIALETAGFLRTEDCDSRAALEAALERVIEIWTITVTSNDTP